MLIQGKILTYGDNLDEVFTVRRSVFIEEQNQPEELVFDDIDQEAMHVIVYEETKGKKAVATGRIYYDGMLCEISKVAVLKEYRNKKYGDFTIRMLLNRAFISGINEVYLESPSRVKVFFEKIGFHQEPNCIESNEESIYHMVIQQSDVVTECNKYLKNKK